MQSQKRIACAVLSLALLSGGAARASGFEDFAGTFAGIVGVSPAEVVDGYHLLVDHGACIPQYADDYLLDAVAVALKVARAQGALKKDFNQCNQKLNVGDKALALVFSKAGKLMGLLSAQQQQQLKSQASGSVGPLPFIARIAECACAAAVTDTPIDAQIKVIKAGVEGAWQLYKIGGKVVALVGEVGSSIAGIAKDFGCAVGFGGCSEFNPARFAQFYFSMRVQGRTAESIRAMFKPVLGLGALRSTSGYPDFLAECEASYQKQLKAERDAADELARLKVNQTVAAQAAAGWAIIWAKAWAADCKDEQCASQMAVVANQRAAEETNPGPAAYGGSTPAMKTAMNNKYNPRVKLNVQLSIAREQEREKIRNDRSVAPEKRLPLLNTMLYLGRAGEFLAHTQAGFGACAEYADRSLVKRCMSEGPTRRYATRALMMADLQAGGCQVQGTPSPRPGTELIYYCPLRPGMTACENFRLGGSRLACLTRPLPKPKPAVSLGARRN